MIAWVIMVTLIVLLAWMLIGWSFIIADKETDFDNLEYRKWILYSVIVGGPFFCLITSVILGVFWLKDDILEPLIENMFRGEEK